ncbi:MAG: hypothetical protein JW904_08585 [Spirochaetales bacterium]|nr:hypothetical protein [Spirochaetales bacterium]
MIVPMKKAAIIVLEKERHASVNALGQLGVVHIASISSDSQTWDALQAERDILSRAYIEITADKKKNKKIRMETVGYDKAFEIAVEINDLINNRVKKESELQQIIAELKRLAPWGTLEPEKIKALEQDDIFVSLMELTKEQLDGLPADVNAKVVSVQNKLYYTVVISVGKRMEVPGKQISLPSVSTKELAGSLSKHEKEIAAIAHKIDGFHPYEASFAAALEKNAGKKEFEEVKAGMKDAAEVAYFSGFVPVTALDDLKKAASENGWGVMLVDPDPEDDVPTLIRNPKPARIIKPVFDFLGTVPGYKEKDISVIFLLFFSIFYAMLIGDAGYGCIFLLLTVVAKLIMRKKLKPELFGLLMVTSVATIVWGAVTNTWFSVDAVANSPIVRWAFVPALAADQAKFLMYVCFTIGVVHLSIAHLSSLVAFRKSLKAFSEMGKLAIIWGMYFMVLNLVLREPLPFFAVHLLLGGLVFIVVFEYQEGNFLKGVAKGAANIFLTLLSIISSFADIVSYVRLYAVSLAGAKIAIAFNDMSSAMGGAIPVVGIIFAVLILFLGHALNIVLALIGVLVHGVRLNMLEFSSHAGMEWTGYSYSPFTYHDDTNDFKEEE